jgi:hypothetical protein
VASGLAGQVDKMRRFGNLRAALRRHADRHARGTATGVRVAPRPRRCLAATRGACRCLSRAAEQPHRRRRRRRAAAAGGAAQPAGAGA